MEVKPQSDHSKLKDEEALVLHAFYKTVLIEVNKLIL